MTDGVNLKLFLSLFVCLLSKVGLCSLGHMFSRLGGLCT